MHEVSSLLKRLFGILGAEVTIANVAETRISMRGRRTELVAALHVDVRQSRCRCKTCQQNKRNEQFHFSPKMIGTGTAQIKRMSLNCPARRWRQQFPLIPVSARLARPFGGSFGSGTANPGGGIVAGGWTVKMTWGQMAAQAAGFRVRGGCRPVLGVTGSQSVRARQSPATE